MVAVDRENTLDDKRWIARTRSRAETGMISYDVVYGKDGVTQYIKNCWCLRRVSEKNSMIPSEKCSISSTTVITRLNDTK